MFASTKVGSSNAVSYVEDVFGTTLYSGTGAAQAVSTPSNFAAAGGAIWLKGRSGATDHAVYDSLRGVQQDLTTTSTAGQTAQSQGVVGFRITDAWTLGSFGVAVAPNALSYINGVFFGVGNTGKVSRSDDNGVTWTLSTVGTTNWSGLAYGNNTYVLCGVVAPTRSSDAVSWTSSGVTGTYPSTQNAIIYANSLFVLVGSNGRISTSPDGITWTLRHTSAVSGLAYYAITYGNGLFVAVGNNSTPTLSIATSPDGVNWTAQTPSFGTSGRLGSVAYGNGTYVTVGSNARVATSTDGVNWTARSTGAPSTRLFTDVVYSNGYFVLSGYDTVTSSTFSLYVSADNGATWTEKSYPAGTSGSATPLGASPTKIIGATTTTQYISSVGGVTIGTLAKLNTNAATYTSWAFARQPRFFDVVTYTGNGANRTISHDLNAVPGCVIVKRLDTTGDWQVYHRSLTSAANSIQLNTTAAQAAAATVWNSTAPTNTVFSVGTDASVNANGGAYVAYLFAHDAGGFGAANVDNVISCGSFTTDATRNATVTLGWEPQLVLVKASSTTGNWFVVDSMRGMPVSNNSQNGLRANLLDAEGTTDKILWPTATGFYTDTNTAAITASQTYIYIAIRRPMKAPTSGTSVFNPTLSSAGTGTKITTNFPVDLQWWARTAGLSTSPRLFDRLRGVNTTTTASLGPYLKSSSTDAEVSDTSATRYWDNTGFQIPGTNGTFATIYWSFARATGFMDIVCYTGNGVAGRSVTHNLGAKPLINFVKKRNAATGWIVYTDLIDGSLDYLSLNTTAAKLDSAESPPTSTLFYLSAGTNVNNLNDTYVAYPFGNVSGVSKCGVYTGTGGAQTIDCGFAAGARFVLIKRTDSTGDWYVWDTARGINAGTDPYLLVNTINAQVTTNDYISPQSVGFGISASAPAALNASGGTYLYLAIA